ncbi:hypothetical protein CKM354_000618700 [Cercospora kikuchii]|uniref:Uncharacterized protein n=1 Tax=Cercospora kikuchii TaxID=84275 RepID=A0A9P3CNJ6_9PEZI|nr:uncharacterized protein CKM354_000618700 [Cercospora kikuchii]GIZ42940.1 hypothetical protein CKM354_000618700 [Cercospora kikuchii]
MSGTIIITGAAGGLGLALSEMVLQRPEQYHAVFTVRDEDAPNAKPLRDLIESNSSKHRARIVSLDLSKSTSIRNFCTHINSQVSAGELPPIRALVLNAAYIPNGNDRKYAEFVDGQDGAKIEMNFAVNYLANVLLALLLLESMEKLAGRIVYVSSIASDPAKGKVSSNELLWDPEDLAFARQLPAAGSEARDGMRRYGMSKLCQIMFMQKLQKHLNSTPSLNKLRVIGVDPGVMVHPNLIKKHGNNSIIIEKLIGPALMAYSKVAQYVWPNGTFRTVNKSASDIVRAALDLDSQGESLKGAYLNGSKHEEPTAWAKDEGKQNEIWEFSLKLLNLNKSELGLC